MSAKNTTPAPDEQLEQDAAEYGLSISADGRTVSGSLKYGVEYDGQYHHDFELRLLTVRDDMAIAAGLSGFDLAMERQARSFVRLGGVPPEALTGAYLADHLIADDMDVLYLAKELLAKKRHRPTTTATPS